MNETPEVSTVADLGVRHIGLTIRTNGWQGVFVGAWRAFDPEWIELRIDGVLAWVKPSQPCEVIR